ncbi:unnamed protein product [Adineta steineri]|uniref:Uncharacterized protein n=1 Tax=Adineta steineri TaxID=433720 RepID=A0A820NXL8_9BILA|nr:unnamed protein product [Adineta steineri]
MSSVQINNIELDFFDSGTDIVATTGVGPRISFLVRSDHRQQIFIEHRSSTNIPSIIDLNTVCTCFDNVAKQVAIYLPTSNIT